uniref:Ig-like domain-containing protein n=1 Tax=Nothoprocta perdicaria TaxID=30464 RepID=A0A8C7A0B8_NOTPE
APGSSVSAHAPAVYPLTPCSCAGDNVTVACSAAGFFPEPLEVTWASAPPSAVATFPAAWAPDTFYQLVSSLTTTAANGQAGGVACTVRHPATDTSVTKSFNGESGPGWPLEVLVGPWRSRLTPGGPDVCPVPTMVTILVHDDGEDSEEVQLVCVTEGLAEQAQVQWLQNREPLEAQDEAFCGRCSDGRSLQWSRVSIGRRSWEQGVEVTCRVSSAGLEEPIEESIRNTCPGQEMPQVYVFPPAAEELAREEAATLTCLVTSFRPKDVLVTWTQGGQPVPSGSYQVFGPEEDAGGYTVYSALRTSAAAWQRGDAFACVVAHEGLPMTFVHKGLDKSAGKATAVNVSVVLADADVTCY